MVTRDVTDLVDVPRPGKKSFKTWNVDEVNTFLGTVADHPWHPIYVIAIYCGLRQGEILGLYREDIDLDKGSIHVRRQLTSITGRGLTITEPKTERARWPVTLPDPA